MLTTIPLGVIDSAGSRVYAKWNSANKNSTVNLTNGDLTLLTTTQFGSVISNIGIVPGDTGYFELTPTVASPTGGGPFMGMGTFIPSSIAISANNYVGGVEKSFAFRGNGGSITNCIITKLTSSAPKYVGVNNCSISVGTPCVVNINNHNYYTGMEFIFLNPFGPMPGGLLKNTKYYVHVIDNNNFYIASTLANSVSGPYLRTTYAGSGIPSVNPTGICVSDVVSTDVFSFAINNATGKCNIYKNGILDPTALGVNAGVFINFYVPTGETWYACASADTTGSSVTANFGQNAWDSRTASLRSTLETAGYKIGIYN
jgi:hypothetical protein